MAGISQPGQGRVRTHKPISLSHINDCRTRAASNFTLGDKTVTTKVQGSHSWLLILCRPSDATLPTWPGRDYFVNFISGSGAGGLYDYWSEISGRRLNLGGSRVLGWYSLTQTVAQINDLTRSGAAAVAREAAIRAGENLSGYRYTLAFFAGSNHFGAMGSDVAAEIRVTHGQPGWRWCSKCKCLTYWDGSRTPGPCAADGRPLYSFSLIVQRRDRSASQLN